MKDLRDCQLLITRRGAPTQFAYISVRDFEDDDSDLGKDVSSTVLAISKLNQLLRSELALELGTAKIVWKGETALGGIQDIQIKTDIGFCSTLLRL